MAADRARQGELVIAEAALGAADADERVIVTRAGARVRVSFVHERRERFTGRVMGVAQVSFQGMRTFGQRVRFELPLVCEFEAVPEAEREEIVAEVLEWLLELAE